MVQYLCVASKQVRNLAETKVTRFGLCRVAHTPKNAIHEAMLDNFLDFVIWGHEHECKITPQVIVIATLHHIVY